MSLDKAFDNDDQFETDVVYVRQTLLPVAEVKDDVTPERSRKMAPTSGRLQLLLGAAATVTVAFVSYLVVKRRQISGRSSSAGQKGFSGDDESTASEKLVSEGTARTYDQAPEDLQYEEKHYTESTDKNRSDDDKTRDNLTCDGQDQTSFIVIDNGEGALPPGSGQNPRKSDRSSDESSYDVIDDDQLVETEAAEDFEKDEGGHALDDANEQGQPEQDTFLESNETSMFVIEDLDQSRISKSESSLYASVDESRLEEPDVCEERGKKVEVTDVPEEDESIAYIDSASQFPGGANVLPSHEGRRDPVNLDQAKVTIPISHPVHVSEQPFSAQGRERTSSTTKSDVTQATTERSDEQFSASNVTEVLTLCQNSPSTVSKENIHTLVDLLHKKIPELHSTVLNCVLRVAAFTQNVKSLRDSGCFPIVADQIQEVCQTVLGGEGQPEMLNSLCQVLTNLTLDPKSQTEFENTVPSLIDLLLNTDRESIKLSVLRPLINFSSQPSFHSHYTRAVQDLYTLLDTGSHVVRVQSAKVLVNLSLDIGMVPHMLAAKAPASLVQLLDLPTPTDLTLRTVTMLANIVMAMHKEDLSLASLPVQDKAASHETMYMALHGVNNLPTLRSKVFRLTRHRDEDVSQQASKLYQYLQQTSQ